MKSCQNKTGYYRFFKSFYFPCLLIGISIYLFPVQVFAQARPAEFVVDVNHSLLRNLQDSASVFRAKGEKNKISLKLPSKEGVAQVVLEPRDIRSPDYRAQIITSSGVKPDPYRVELFSGHIVGSGKTDMVALSLIENENKEKQVKGYFRRNKVLYSIQSIGQGNNLLSVKETDVNELAQVIARCGVDTHSGYSSSPAVLPDADGLLFPDAPPKSSATLKEAEVATDADYEYVQAAGTASAANADILNILNSVDVLYQNQLGVTFVVTFQNAWSVSSDPYTTTNSDLLLDEFTNYWNANFSAGTTYDLAHLWTGKDLDGSTVGIAFMGALCSAYRYGLSMRFNDLNLDVPLVAHEIGHNFGAPHDSCGFSDKWIMCPSLKSGANTFSSSSVSQITTEISTASCLSASSGGGGGNNPPVLDLIGSKQVQEGVQLAFTLTASDPDNDGLSFSSSALPSGAALNGADFTYTPPSDTVTGGQSQAVVSITFTVTDSNGATDSEVVQITVLNVNNPPTLTAPAAQTIAEGDLFSLSLQASDPDGDQLSYQALNLPQGATLVSTSGVITWRPAGNQAGVYTISLKVSDPSGASDTGTLQITVNDTAGVANLPSVYTAGDFDGDGLSNLAIFRPSTGEWFFDSALGVTQVQNVKAAATGSVQFGLPGDVPMPEDYNGDNITDYAVFRPSSGEWFFKMSGTGTSTSKLFGSSGDIPVAGDFSGDNRADLGLFRPSTGVFIYLKSEDGGSQVTNVIGQKGDIPVNGDYDGDGIDDIALWTPSNGTWTIKRSTGGTTVFQLGGINDIPVPADYDGDGKTEIAVWNPVTGEWTNINQNVIQFGKGGDVPVPADFNGDGADELALWRPESGVWYILDAAGNVVSQQYGLQSDNVALVEYRYYAMRNSNASPANFLVSSTRTTALYSSSLQALWNVGLIGVSSSALSALAGDTILSGDYDGDGALDTVVYRLGAWTVYFASGGSAIYYWGTTDDEPVSADFDGDGISDLAIFRPSTGEWWIVRSSDGLLLFRQWGIIGDEPLPGDYNGDGVAEQAVWRPSTGEWFVLDGRSGTQIDYSQWGLPGDRPIVADFDRDGRLDKVVNRPAEGGWYLRYSGGGDVFVQWGLSGDYPVPAAYATAGKTDFGVYRPSEGKLYVRSTEGSAWVLSTSVGSSVESVALTPFAVLKN